MQNAQCIYIFLSFFLFFSFCRDLSFVCAIAISRRAQITLGTNIHNSHARKARESLPTTTTTRTKKKEKEILIISTYLCSRLRRLISAMLLYSHPTLVSLARATLSPLGISCRISGCDIHHTDVEERDIKGKERRADKNSRILGFTSMLVQFQFVYTGELRLSLGTVYTELLTPS